MSLLKAHHFRPSLTEEVRNPSLAVSSPPEQLTRTVDTNVQNRVLTKSAVDALNLGSPMDIQSAASLLGCSSWTVRQKLIPRGATLLPGEWRGQADILPGSSHSLDRSTTKKEEPYRLIVGPSALALIAGAPDSTSGRPGDHAPRLVSFFIMRRAQFKASPKFPISMSGKWLMS